MLISIGHTACHVLVYPQAWIVHKARMLAKTYYDSLVSYQMQPALGFQRLRKDSIYLFA